MRKRMILTALAAVAIPTLLMAADEARLMRFPATNGSEIVFSYAGDLYKVPATGGEAQRLTSYVGYEMFPRFSPDGKTIAFTGQYDGNTEVYTMPSSGGEPLRITYTATNSRDDLGDRMGPNNIVMTWTPDGNGIVYRNRISDGFSGKLYTVNKEGGLSEVVPLPEGGFCRICCYNLPDHGAERSLVIYYLKPVLFYVGLGIDIFSEYFFKYFLRYRAVNSTIIHQNN